MYYSVKITHPNFCISKPIPCSQSILLDTTDVLRKKIMANVVLKSTYFSKMEDIDKIFDEMHEFMLFHFSYTSVFIEDVFSCSHPQTTHRRPQICRLLGHTSWYFSSLQNRLLIGWFYHEQSYINRIWLSHKSYMIIA